ncbi:MAG TPA: dihydroorotate dehydrogenase electron transfer subunit [Bacteroidales bacterium]|jgi:dihydroorotate dehydrogenase electron transfer subunit|nr:dihydroorotate dehydrogenase electron transfer subunit [Bacteroidota bacterium]HJN06571.1 dihydroorotate dehydrogenase electron transfer subunit [Bacteroidales bacterium]|tara:strand:+ start:3882 stop:4643 length:762 start_codon:yes stop_codon:yes gene_type:complete
MKRIQDFKVKDYEWLNADNFILALSSESNIEDIKPGNFAEIKIPNSHDIFLRRPFSILDVDHKTKTIKFYVKAIGKGTHKLGTLSIGSILNIIYPLGNSFNILQQKNVLIIGGGSGIAPFILLASKLKKENNQITFLIGARSKEDVFLIDEFSKFGDVLITTEDGSLGEKGVVTQHSVFSNHFPFDHIYTCGPDPMMKAVATIAKEKNVSCEASLENMMACGIGACLCCITSTVNGNKCVCTEGPVFNTKDLK